MLRFIAKWPDNIADAFPAQAFRIPPCESLIESLILDGSVRMKSTT
jgi:hypothetical protein